MQQMEHFKKTNQILVNKFILLYIKIQKKIIFSNFHICELWKYNLKYDIINL